MRNVISVMRDAMHRAGATSELIERTVAVIEDDRRAQNRARQRKYHAEHNANGVTNANNVISVNTLKAKDVYNANGVNSLRENNTPLETSLGGIGSAEGKGGTKRGTRIDPNFRPPDHDWAKLGAETGFDQAQLELETRKFRDYWAGRAGVGGAKLDWVATWRNWIRNAVERSSSRAYVSPMMAANDKILREIKDGKFRVSRRGVCSEHSEVPDSLVHSEGERPGDLSKAVGDVVHRTAQGLIAKNGRSD